MRYTPSGTAVCTFGLATNRTWVTEGGDKKEETEFHRIVAWNKLAELCSQLLFKGRRIYVEGRLQTRQWTGQDGAQRVATEIVIEDMIILDSKRQGEEGFDSQAGPSEDELVASGPMPVTDEPAAPTAAKPAPKSKAKTKDVNESAEDVADDIPF